MVPKVENLKEKSSPTFGFSTLAFNFQVGNLKTSSGFEINLFRSSHFDFKYETLSFDEQVFHE